MLLLKQIMTVDVGVRYLFWRKGWWKYGPQMQNHSKLEVILWKYIETSLTFSLNILKSRCSEKWRVSNLGWMRRQPFPDGDGMVNTCPQSAHLCEGSTSLWTLVYWAMKRQNKNNSKANHTLSPWKSTTENIKIESHCWLGTFQLQICNFLFLNRNNKLHLRKTLRTSAGIKL